MNDLTTKVQQSFDSCKTVEEIAQKFVTFEGEPFSLEEHTPYKFILSAPFPNIVIQSGRQVAKSTYLSIKLILESIANKYFRSMFVTTSEMQMNDFSRSRMSKVLNDSKMISKLFFSGKNTMDNIAYKQLKNSSEIFFRYASDNADRIRGISANLLTIDECQDINPDIVPVIQEVLTATKRPYFFRTGTPKTEEHYLTWAYNKAEVKHEWVIPCPECRIYNIPDLDIVGKNHLVCKKCGNRIYAKAGHWHTNTPNPYVNWSDDAEDNWRVRTYAFRIPQLIIPHVTDTPQQWAQLKWKLKNYNDERLNNEVLGLPYSLGARLIAREELNELCEEETYLEERPGPTSVKYPVKIAGIDWTGGGKSGKSRTSLVIIGWNPTFKKVKILYYKIYPISNPITNVEDIARILLDYHRLGRGIIIGADAGEGAVANGLLNQLLTGKKNGDKAMHTFMFGNYRRIMQYDKHTEHIQVNKTAALDTFFFQMIKQRQMRFCKSEQMQELFDHFLAEYETVTSSNHPIKIWTHNPDKPDDGLMATVFAWLTLRFFILGQKDLLT